jgi:hypothetical protein
MPRFHDLLFQINPSLQSTDRNLVIAAASTAVGVEGCCNGSPRRKQKGAD